MKRSLLRGVVSNGMFPDESVFLITDYRGKKVSTIVPSSKVTNLSEAYGELEVRVLSEEGDITLVMLPGEVLESGPVLAVKKSELGKNGSSNGHQK